MELEDEELDEEELDEEELDDVVREEAVLFLMLLLALPELRLTARRRRVNPCGSSESRSVVDDMNLVCSDGMPTMRAISSRELRGRFRRVLTDILITKERRRRLTCVLNKLSDE